MLIVNRPQTDPYFNIAAEEYLLKTVAEDCFMVWRNDVSIIVGKHQNALAEINYPFVKEHHIPVIRRISGGGTVFHDPGNLNFSFIAQGEREKLVDYRKFTDPIITVLNQLGVPARFEGKNDIKVNGLKISGNAEHVYKNRVLHHGTLLFSSDLGLLKKALKADSERFSDKAIKSVKSKVSNISDFLNEPISIADFSGLILQYLKNANNNSRFYSLTSSDVSSIQQLVNEKYTTWKWNFGYSPQYELENSIKIGREQIQSRIEVKNGQIINVDFSASINKQKFLNLVKMTILNQQHEEKTLLNLFQTLDSDPDLNHQQLLNLFF